jgi:hypothetical protein
MMEEFLEVSCSFEGFSFSSQSANDDMHHPIGEDIVENFEEK